MAAMPRRPYKARDDYQHVSRIELENTWWNRWIAARGNNGQRRTYISPFAIREGFASGLLGLGRGLPFGLVGIGLEVTHRGGHV